MLKKADKHDTLYVITSLYGLFYSRESCFRSPIFRQVKKNRLCGKRNIQNHYAQKVLKEVTIIRKIT